MTKFKVRRNELTDGSATYDVLLSTPYQGGYFGGNVEVLNAISESQANTVAKLLNEAVDSAMRYNGVIA